MGQKDFVKRQKTTYGCMNRRIFHRNSQVEYTIGIRFCPILRYMDQFLRDPVNMSISNHVYLRTVKVFGSWRVRYQYLKVGDVEAKRGTILRVSISP